MSIFESSRVQMLNYSRQKSFSLTSPSLTATVLGIITDHNQSIDQETGNAINGRNAHASIHEDELTAKGFTSLKILDWVITDGPRKYKIAQTIPNTTTGLIVCVLKDLK